jgi:hypothetical protein
MTTGLIAGSTAYLDYLVGQTIREIRAVQTGVNTANMAAHAMMRVFEENNNARRIDRELLTRTIAESRASTALHAVDSYLDQLEEKGQLEFNRPKDKADVSRKLKDRVRPVIIDDLLLRADMTDTQLRKRVEQLVARHLRTVFKQ